MSQKFPEVGLRGVFEITGFTRNYSRYQTMMRDIDRTTQQTTKQINQATKGMTQDVVRSFTDFARKSSIVQAAFDSLSPGAAIAEYQRLSQAFADLGDKAQVNVGIFDHLVNSGVGLADAMRVAGGQVQFNLSVFDQLIHRGADVETAFQRAAGGADALSGRISILGRSFSVMAIAVAAATAALKIGVRIVQESNEAYDELSQATRQVRLQTGLLTQEASTWVAAMDASGISAATSERALTSFLGKIADLRRDMRDGKDLTSDFARAMGTLGISVVNSQGALRSTDEILGDVDRAFQQLGPGIVSAQLATDLFGYSGRFLLPILTDQEQSLSDLTGEVQKYGAALGAIDTQKYEELRKSQTRLAAATEGWRIQIGRGWVEFRTNFNNFISDLLNGLRKADAAIRAFQKTFLSVEGQMTPFRELGALYRENFEYFLTGESEMARAAEESAQARANAAQELAAAVSAAEEQVQQERLKTLQQLDQLKTQLSQKLADIDQDAAQKWEDILVTRQRDAFDRSLQIVWRLQDLKQAYDERLADIEADFAKRWDDILVKRQRDALERALRLAWRYEDLARSAEQSRQDAIRDAAERERENREEIQRRIEDAERDARERREKLEREHQQRLRDIQQKFLDTALEAARRNDAVAVARAQRERARDLRDEQERYVDEQKDLEDSLQKKREAIERDRQQREDDHRKELERTLRRIDENYQRQLESLQRQNERERILREMRYAWELEDLNAAKAEQLQAAEDWRAKQMEELQKQYDREEILRKVQYERERADFEKNWQRRIDDAQQWYERERNELAEHLKLTGNQLEAAYQVWIREAAEAAAEVARAASDALAQEIERYQHLLTESERQRAGLTPAPTAPASLPPPQQMRRNAQGVWVPGAPVLSQAEGGVVYARGPTNVVMGDAGPETGIFLPGGAGSSMTVNHNFGRMGVDFAGLPGGMNTQQVQSIVYQVMTQLAKGIQIPR